jgi:hypothetical protein
MSTTRFVKNAQLWNILREHAVIRLVPLSQNCNLMLSSGKLSPATGFFWIPLNGLILMPIHAESNCPKTLAAGAADGSSVFSCVNFYARHQLSGNRT